MAWIARPLLGLIPRALSNASVRGSHWHISLLALRESLPMRSSPITFKRQPSSQPGRAYKIEPANGCEVIRAEPKKKKKVDPRREQSVRDRLRKKLKKLERVPPELIPIEDFASLTKYFQESRVRDPPKLTEEESERRALLMKEWSRYKQKEHEKEQEMMQSMIEAQHEALQELRLESEDLYQAAIKRDQGLVPLELPGCSYTPPVPDYQAPDGKYKDTTKVYTQ